MKSNTIEFDEKYTVEKDSPNFQKSTVKEFINIFQVTFSDLTLEQIMNPTEEQLQTLIRRTSRNPIGLTRNAVLEIINDWEHSYIQKTVIVEYKANKDLVRKYKNYQGNECYEYKGTIHPKDIQRIYPDLSCFIHWREWAKNPDFFNKLEEQCSKGIPNPLLKIQPSINLTTLFNNKIQIDLENKIQNTVTSNMHSST